MASWRNSQQCYQLIIALLLHWVYCASAQDCSSTTFDFTQTQYSRNVAATEVNTVIESHIVTKVATVGVEPMQPSALYIKAELKEQDGQTQLVISTREDFGEYFKTGIYMQLIVKLAFKCSTGNREVVYIMPLQEGNYFDPEFGKGEYRIQIGLPLPKNIDITQFVEEGKGIVAHDYDVSNYAITFTLSENPYFAVDTLPGSGAKEFSARLRTTSMITHLNEGFSVTITGTDAGNPPRTSTAIITIVADTESVYLLPPQFQQSLYRHEYKYGEAFTPVQVSLLTDTYDASVTLELSGDDAALFTVKATDDHSGAIVTLAQGAVIPIEKIFLSVILTASRTGVELKGHAAIVVEIEGRIIPAFEQPIYAGKIDESRVIHFIKPIALESETIQQAVNVQLLGDDAQFFTVTVLETTVSIEAGAKLTEEVIANRSAFHFVVEAVKPNVGSGISFVVLEVVKADGVLPKFDQLYYEGTVTEEGVAQIPIILITGDTENLKFSFSGDNTLFAPQIDRNKITLTPNGINEESLKGRFFLLVRIVATLDGDVVAETVVIINILRELVVTPLFSENFVTALLDEQTHELSSIKIVVREDTYLESTVLVIKDSKNLFELEKTAVSNEVTIKLREGVQIPPASHFSLIVEATNPRSLTTSCFILVDVTPIPTPEFEQLLYEGVINSSNQLQELKLKLKPETYNDAVEFDLEGDDATYFKLQKLESNELLVIFNESNIEDVIKNRSSLTFNVSAKRSLTLESRVPVVIQVHKTLIPVAKFEKPFYKSTIDKDLQLIPFETIKIMDSSAPEELQLEIILNNTDLFLPEVNQDGIVNIRLKNELTEEHIKDIKWFQFVLEATDADVGSTYATIVIDVTHEAVIIPEFTTVSYTGTVDESSKTITFSEKITLKEGTFTDQVAYAVLGKDFEFIDLKKNEDHSLEVSLKDEVTAEQLSRKSQLNFVLQATNPGSPSSVSSAVVEIIRPVPAVFTKSSFRGTLSEDQAKTDFTYDRIQLQDITIIDSITLSVSGNHADFFNASVGTENEIEVTLKPSVNWEQVRFLSYLALTLAAVNPGAAPGTAALIIEVKNQPVVTATFTKALYRGTLKKGTRDVAFAASEVITMKAETITDTLEFKPTDSDYELFQVTRNGEVFQVALKPSIDESNYNGRDLLNFLIEINNKYGETDSASVVIAVEQDQIVSPIFAETIYQGTIHEFASELEMTSEISFVGETVTVNTEVGLAEGDSKWFSADIVNSKVTIRVKEEIEIPWAALSSRKTLNFILQALNPGSQVAIATIVLDIERAEIPVPKFTASSFHGFLEENSEEVIFQAGQEISLEQQTLVTGYSLSLTDDDYQIFEFEYEDGVLKIRLKESESDEQIRGKQYLRFTVAASNPGSCTITAPVVVDVKGEVQPSNVPVFEKSTYKGSVDSSYQLVVEETIAVVEQSFTQDVVLRLTDANSNLLKLTQVGREAHIELSKEITDEDLNDLKYIYASIQAQNGQGLKSACLLIVTLPEKETVTCPPPNLDCTECFNCTTLEPEFDVPMFLYGNYNFRIRTGTTGMVGVVRAVVKDPLAVLDHVAEVDDDYLQLRISLTNDGQLYILEPLEPLEYTFLVKARNPTTEKYSKVSVHIDVLSEQECPIDPDDPKLMNVEKLLVIEHLEEEVAHSSIFPSTFYDCEYKLIDERPHGHNYFSINSETNWLTSQSFDRENKTLFAGMVVPQFQLRLRLVCPGEQTVSRINKRSLVDTENINFARDVTVLQVIVIDVNDNDPYFVRPQGWKPVNIAFPEPSIATGMMLSELMTVAADDLDEGINAKIRYSVGSNQDFGIDSETGVIYPLKNAMKEKDSIRLTVMATDRDGASDGRSSSIELNVYRLNEDNLVAVTLSGSKDVTVVLDEFNTNSEGIQLESLNYAMVPSIDEHSSRKVFKQGSSEDTNLRLIVYAFDEQYKLQDTEVIKRIIKASSLSETAVVDSYSEVACLEGNKNCEFESLNVGLIAATSVFGVLFLISAGAAVFLYLRFVRPFNLAQANPSDIVQLENDFDISPPPSPPSDATKKVLNATADEDGRKISLRIVGITEHESDDTKGHNERLAYSLGKRLDETDEFGTISSRTTTEEPAAGELRNVKFNEMVERIEVEDHGSDEDNMSDYNVRM